MARIQNPKRALIRNVLAYCEDQIHSINRHLTVEEVDDPNYTQSYRDGRDQAAKDDFKNLVKMFRYGITKLPIGALPAAFDDAEVDAIDPEIRTFDDGN